ncbi:MAG: ion channel [Bacteroidetes bacterium]|nr:ion channel [Bacteroidota bacterium]
MKSKPSLPEDEFKDLGFGTKISAQSKRLINKDGSFNVERRGLPFLESLSFYHWLLEMSWLKFNGVVLLAYVVINLIFASLYMLIGVEHLGGITGTTLLEKFLDAFFFSGQTITTVGYGVIHPIGFWASFISLIESMAGLLGFALATGLLYGRFSRPNAKLFYSKNAIIAPYHGMTAFEFKIANARKNQLIEVEAQVMLTMKESSNGKALRKYYPLTLERNRVNFLPLTWTIVHPIDEDSPLKDLTPDDLKEAKAEFLILIKAYDETFSQSVHSRTSYTIEEITWNARFSNIYNESEKGITIVEMSKFNEIEKVQVQGKFKIKFKISLGQFTSLRFSVKQKILTRRIKISF